MTSETANNAAENHSKEVIEWLGRDRKVSLLVNFRHAKIERPEWIAEESDLFACDQPEIRELSSLHLVGDRGLEELWSLSQQLKNHDACIWLFSDLPCEELAKRLKIYRGWYSRPSILKLHLEQGAKDFVKGLLSGVHVVLLDIPGAEDYHIFANPEVTIDWDQFNP